MNKDKLNYALECEFKHWKFPVPPVSTANWDLESWRKWIYETGHQQIGDWIKKGFKNEFWINQVTKEESLFHPASFPIVSQVIKAGNRFIPNKKD